MRIEINEAAEKLSELIDAVLAGERVIIVEGAVPIVEIVRLSPKSDAAIDSAE